MVRHPTDIPFNYEMLQVPISQYHDRDTVLGNINTETETVAWGNRPYLTFNKERYHIGAIRNFRCFLIMKVRHITGGYDENKFGEFMWLRALALMESGVHGVWKKWEEMRRNFNESGPLMSEVEEFVPLSFERSDIQLQFYLYFVCVSVTILALLAEISFFSIMKVRTLQQSDAIA